MTMRVGVLLPTYNRPDLARSAVLQMAAQTRKPEVVCVHQNGHPDCYDWAVRDLPLPFQIAWLHTADKIPQHQWYSIPLTYLLEQGCTHFFWADHDDLYLANHIETGVSELQHYDFSVARHCGLLFTKGADFRYAHQVEFDSHAPGGMSSTMCFNRAFATQLLLDLVQDTGHQYADNVVANVTMPKFRCLVSDRRTTVYHSHEGSLTSAGWLEATFGS